MDEVLGCFVVPLDGRFSAVRSSESNLGNWVIITHQRIINFHLKKLISVRRYVM